MLLREGNIGQGRHDILVHVRGRGIPIELAAPDEENCLGDMAVAGASGRDRPLLALYKGEGGKLNDSAFLDSVLEEKIEVGEKLSLGCWESRALRSTQLSIKASVSIARNRSIILDTGRFSLARQGRALP